MPPLVFVTTGTLATFGTTYRALGLAKEIAKHGWKPHIIMPGWPENRARFSSNRADDVVFHFSEGGGWSEMQSKYQILDQVKAPVIHCLDPVKRSFLPSLAFRFRRPCRLIVDIDEHLSRVYGFPKNVFSYCLEQCALRFSDGVIFASKALHQRFGSAVRAGRSLYLPYALDLQSFESHRRGWEKLRDIWTNRKIIGYLGSFYPRYPVKQVVECAMLMVQRRGDTIFVLMGTGPMVSSLQALVAKQGLGDRILFLGFVSDEDLPRYLSAVDVLVFPIEDTWVNRARCPGKTYHYLAAGVPIVTNRVGEVAGALGEEASYFEYDKMESLLQALERSLQNSTRMPEEARLERARHQSWETRALVYRQFLEQVCFQ